LLIEKNAKLDIYESSKDNPYFLSLIFRNFKITKLLISKGMDLYQKDDSGENIIDILTNKQYGRSIRWGVPDTIEYSLDFSSNKLTEFFKSLIDQGFYINTTDKTGRTLLIHSIINGNEALARFLISRKADINHIDSSKYNAVIYSITHLDFDLMELLIENGADLIYRDSNNLTAFGNYINFSPVIREDKLNTLISFHADLNEKYSGNVNPLLLYLSKQVKDTTNIVSKLLTSESFVIQDNAGNGCLHYAASQGYFNISKYLISMGAKVNSVNNEGNTPLIIAAANGYEDLVKILLINGADKTLKNKNGDTAYDVAKDETLRRLLSK
jgi:ankyrin repeat protein